MSLGSWLRDRPRLLERAYQFTEGLFTRLRPLIERLGYEQADGILRPFEEPAKRLVFDCRMCGQCVLHSTGMTCPMTCPKNLRNGPCGGVRPNGNCEVVPDMRCIWTEAYERSQQMTLYAGELLVIQPPVNHRLQGGSAWINMLTGADRAVPPGWAGLPTVAKTGRQPAPADSGGAVR
jgi:hypothetical protein